jgi:hypothetical protein
MTGWEGSEKKKKQQQAKETDTMKLDTRGTARSGAACAQYPRARCRAQKKVPDFVFDLLCSICIAQRGDGLLEVEPRGTKVGAHHRLRVAAEGVLTEAEARCTRANKQQPNTQTEESEGDEKGTSNGDESTAGEHPSNSFLFSDLQQTRQLAVSVGHVL